MNEIVFFIDLHGVLVNSKLMLANYERTIIETYNKFGVSNKDAFFYHHQGLKQFNDHLNYVRSLKITGQPFLSEMNRGDKEWDRLMQSFVIKGHSEFESRNIEFQSGKYSDSFYSDGKSFLTELTSKKLNQIDFFIASNSHTSHMKGLLTGAGFENIPDDKLLGWDKMECLKSEENYYTKLFSISNARTKFLIGNSKDEMILGKKAGFQTIFLTREFNGKYDFDTVVDYTFDTLENILDVIQKKFMEKSS